MGLGVKIYDISGFFLLLYYEINYSLEQGVLFRDHTQTLCDMPPQGFYSPGMGLEIFFLAFDFL